MKKGSILIVDDNISILKSLQLLLKSEYQQIDIISNPEQIKQMFAKTAYDLVLLDMNFKTGINTGNEGLFWLKKILDIDSDAVVILITAYGDIELAVKAIKQGATDFVQKPWDAEKLLATLHSAYKLRTSKYEIAKLKNKHQVFQENITNNHFQIIGKSKAMIEVFSMIEKVAATDANVLLLGENGTGKDLFARLIHLKSKRAKEIFIAVDVGSISESLFESELFGYKKGAFTDAKEDRIGKIEAANGGTLFLDEIANLPPSMQAKLLRTIQEKQITKLGSNKPIDLDIRLITATNKSVDQLINDGLFREDLYFRINTIEITIPPLRKRKDDIIMIAEFFLKKYREKYEKPQLKLNQDAIDKLTQYYWPGNVRELKHSIEKAVILSESNLLTPEDFFFKTNTEMQDEVQSFKLNEFEKEALFKALAKHRNNLSNVAKEMGISRTTLYKKIKKYDL
ncbi:MAG: sigma-54 dependent transcriptional regulator [Bacteroidetes bacterium]|nr:sigma-54 dependent transcriptional regulator [Bacteroidota bacterium]